MKCDAVKLLLANPAGLWALLAIPVVIVIHMLQERSRKVRTSTLFLLERVKPESVGGARLERLRNSVPLWLQLLAALIIAWLLCEPRWIRENSRQTVAVVLDSSVSMSAFKKETRVLLEKSLSKWSRSAAHTDWHLLESVPRKPVLYAGTSLAGVLAAYDQWEPGTGEHPPEDALFTASSLMRGGAGVVIFVTDHKQEVPSDVALLSAGSAIENVGFAGGSMQLIERSNGSRWRALLKNYGREPASREWWMEDESGATHGEKHKVTLEAGQSFTLEGELPPSVEHAVLVMTGDRFTWDDRLPLQKPKPRTVRVASRLEGASGDLLKKMFLAMDGVEFGSLTPDLMISEIGTGIDSDAIQVGGTTTDPGVIDPAWIGAEDHRLTRDLSWSGLLCGRPYELTVGDDDKPLLWKGDRVLAMLSHRRAADGRTVQRLALNWDLGGSNAARVPAVLVMLQRFVEMVREKKREPWAGNFEAAQKLELPDLNAPRLSCNGQTANFAGRTPEKPGFFEISADGKTFVSGAAQFADTRESDFRNAEPLDTTGQRRMEAALKQSEADPWTPLWLVLIAGCMAVAWAWRTGARRRVATPAQNLNLQTGT